MEAADGGGFGATGGSGQLLGAAADVSVTVFLPAGAPRVCGRNSGGGGGGSSDVQQCVSEQRTGAASRSLSAQTARAARANSRPGRERATGAQPAGEPCSWHAASSVKKQKKQNKSSTEKKSMKKDIGERELNQTESADFFVVERIRGAFFLKNTKGQFYRITTRR